MAKLPVVEFYANDTHPVLVISLDDGADVPSPIDLSDVQAVLIKVAEDFEAESNLFIGECDIVGDPTDGDLSYQFKAGELQAGGWIGEITLLYNDYTVLTMPHFQLKVSPDLPGDDAVPTP